MWGWILRLIPWSRFAGLFASGWLRLGLIAALVVATGYGVWSVATWRCAAQEQARLEAALAEAQAERDRTVAALGDWYRHQLQVAEARGRTKEVIREKVVDRRECDVPEPVVRLLDAHRQGLPEAAGGAAGGAAESAPVGGLPQRAELQAHADLGDLYQACRQQIMALRRWYGMTPN